jgi:sigma-B regulation protein RsbU (phosphoserine phosphatase)
MTPQPHKILVVDDEPDVQPLFMQRMRRDIRAGRYELVFAQNGVEALEMLNQDSGIDMVITDINMPKMDGLTLLEQIPSVDPNIRSIIISAYGDMKNIREAMNRGAFDFVTKPLDFEDLQVTIERTLRHLLEWREALSSRDQLVALQNELNIARQMQQSILPAQFPRGPDFQVYASMTPARNVGGDFYDIVHLEDNRIGVAIADVSDKGVPAALYMMSSRTLLKGAAIGCESPSQVLDEVNSLLQDDSDTGMFVTLFYGIYDPATNEFTYANGGHNPPLIVHADGSSTVLAMTGGVALGVVPSIQYEQTTVALSPGDTILLYTDGITDATNEEGEFFGLERLQATFAGNPPRDSRAANDAVFEALQNFVGDAAQADDITCLALSRSELVLE